MQASLDTEVEIIRLLKANRGSFVSGQDLSKGLHVSRTAVWKHIEALRKLGYSIEASPAKGYSLKGAKNPFNGIEVASQLSTEIIGRKIYFYPELDSTNLKAFELARAGAPEGTAVIADAQTKGKGRIGRTWESPAGVNLYTSVILRPDIPPQTAHHLTFLFAVAAAEAISGYAPGRTSVKWPNDVLIDAKKTAGILMEMDSELDKIHFVVAGVGVNVNMKGRSFPAGLKSIAASIAERTRRDCDRAEFARALYSAVEVWYKIYLGKGFSPVLDAWKGYFTAEGRKVRVSSFNRTIEGICAGVDGNGALLVRTPEGKVERILSGDVEAVRETQESL